MADWWVQDTADPAHPELRAGQQSGWWGQDAADPGFPATAMPKPEKSQAAGETLDAGSLPIFEPNSGLLVANDMQKDMGPMRAFGGLAAGAASPGKRSSTGSTLRRVFAGLMWAAATGPLPKC